MADTQSINSKSWLGLTTGILLAVLCSTICIQAQDNTAGGKTVPRKNSSG